MSLARSPVSATVVMLGPSPAIAIFDCDLDPAPTRARIGWSSAASPPS